MAERSSETSPDGGSGEAAETPFASARIDALARPPGSRRRPAALPAGTVLGGTYRLDALIGRGGMGTVYKATHRTLRRAFAIKVVVASNDEDARAAWRLVQEARTACAIRHDHIIDVTDLGHTEEGLVYVVMELLEGEDLAQRLAREAGETPPWLPDQEVAEIFEQVLDGVCAAHRAGVIHRDLKPANVFLARRGERVTAKILDFGMSKALKADDASVRLTDSGQIVGTPLYMAPEQSRGGVLDHRSDVYSLGVMMYEALTGSVPFPAETIYESILKHATEAPPPLVEKRPDLPPGVVALVERCLAKDPAARFETAEELRDAWRAAWGRASLPGEAVSRPPEAAPAPRPPRGARAWWAALALVPIAAVAVALARPWWDGERAEPAAPREDAVLVVAAADERDEAPDAEGEAPAAEESVVEPEPAEPAEPASPRLVRIESAPAGALVYRRGGDRLGRTPYELAFDPSAGSIELTLRKQGHRAARITVTPEGPERLVVDLVPRQAPPPLAPPYL